jgi:hypothetical protein
MADPRCPGCSKSMEEGFVPDATHGAILQSHWMPGKPEKATFIGLPVGAKVDRKKQRAIAAWRCPTCGLLSFYASAAPGRHGL